MSNDYAFLVLRFGGVLNNENGVPSYIGGSNRPIRIRSDASFMDLRSIIAYCLNYSIEEHVITLTCRFPLDEGYIATSVDDDQTTQVILSMATSRPLSIYVETVPINSNHESLAIQHSSYTMTEMQSEQVDAEPSNVGYPSMSLIDGYETMCSESSESEREEEEDEFPNIDREILQGHELLQKQANDTDGNVENMISNNEYVEYYRTSKEWDESLDFDGHHVRPSYEQESFIPQDLVKNMCFSNKTDLQFALNGWSILNNVQHKILYSNKTKYYVICVQNDDPIRPCQWRLNAAKRKRLGGIWYVSSISGSHTCSHPIVQGNHLQCTSRFICSFILPCIRQQFDIKPKEIISRVEARFNVKISYIKAWDARRKAIKAVFGSWEESYRSLPCYMEALRSAMPETVYRIQANQSSRFERIYWAFGPSIEGWSHCRPVISVDGTFLLGKNRGTLLTAVGIDANNGLFPLAFAIVESECVESWTWFMECLSDTIPELTVRANLSIISDRHAGIVRGSREIFPHAAHRHCLRHLRENFKKALRRFGISDVETLCQKMYLAGMSDNVRSFDMFMRDISIVSKEGCEWLLERDIVKWSLYHDGGYRYGTMTTNASENFNGVLKRARGLPIQALISSIYYNIVALFLKRSKLAGEFQQSCDSPFVPRTRKELARLENEARKLPSPICINLKEYEVSDLRNQTHKVELGEYFNASCSCNRTQIYHIPCEHLIAAFGKARINHQINVSPFYRISHLANTYAGNFHVIPDKQDWPNIVRDGRTFDLLPPAIRRRSGRPRTSRYRNTMDEPTARYNRQ